LEHERFGSVQVDLVVVSLDLVFVLGFVSRVRSSVFKVKLLTLAWMSLSLMDEKACWFAAIVSVVRRTIFLEDVVVDEMYAEERILVCPLVEVIQTCDCEIHEANMYLE
jgi:hypothetical protein